MARVYSPAHDGKALQNKKQGGPKEAKGGKGGKNKPATPPAEEVAEAQTNEPGQKDEEGEGV